MIDRIHRDSEFYKWEIKPEVSACLCLGSCKLAPNILIDGVLHSYMNPIKLSEYLQKKLTSHR